MNPRAGPLNDGGHQRRNQDASNQRHERHDAGRQEDELDRHAASRIAYKAILRGLFAALALSEIAAQTGAAASVANGGVAGVLRLPFFTPAMLGVFASQILLRPVRAELIATVAFAAVLAWPLYVPVAGDPYGALMAACAALGSAAIVVLSARAVAQRGADRDRVLDVLLPALILPTFVVLAYPMVYLTAALWPLTYDHRLYLADAAFGAPLSFVVGRATAAVPLLPAVCMAVYVALPLALMLVHTLRRRLDVRSNDALVAFVAVTVVGYFGYLAVPVAGPVYAFGDNFPLLPPDPASVTAAKSLVQPMPRNCMPSLHSAWALLVWWNARPLALAPRVAATVFLAITLLATVGLGFHYVVDVVAAFPLTMAAQAWATRTTDARLRRTAIGSGLAATAAWMALVTAADGIAQWPAVACWIAAAAVVGASSWLELRVYAARCQTEQDETGTVAPVPSWRDRSAGVLLVLLGIATFVNWAILTNELVLIFSATNAARGALALLGVAGVVSGAAACRVLATTRPLRAAALAAAATAMGCWFAVPMLPWIRDSYVAAAASGWPALALLALAGPALAPASMFATMFVVYVAQELDDGSRAPGQAAALALSLTLSGVALGSLATAYLLLPSLKSGGAPVALAVVVSIACAALARTAPGKHAEIGDRYRFSHSSGDSGDHGGRDATASPGGRDRLGANAACAMPAALGLLAGLLIALYLHLLIVVIGDTVYSRAQMSFVLFLGIAAGARIAGRMDDSNRALRRYLAFLIACVAVGLLLWSEIPGYFASFRGYVEHHKMTTNFAERELVRLAVSTLMLLPPALGIGAMLTYATTLSSNRRPANGARAGQQAASALIHVLGLGLPAFAIGVLLAGFVMLPLLGAIASLVTTAVLFVLPVFASYASLTARQRTLGGVALALAVLALLLIPRSFDVSRLASGTGLAFEPRTHGKGIDLAESIEGLVSVHEDGDIRRIVVDGEARAQRSTRDLAPTVRELPGLLHARGRGRALVIGFGTGADVRLLRTSGFAEVLVAEPDPARVALAQKHFAAVHGKSPRDEPAVALDGRGAVALDGRGALVLDGRGALVLDHPPFDLIRIEAIPLTNPRASSLYTRELYELAAARLAPGGVLQQDIALEALSATALTSVLASARRSFDQVRVYFLGDRASLVACSGHCELRLDTDAPVRETGVLLGIGEATARETIPLGEGGWLDPAATDRLLEESAGKLGVATESLGSRDTDLFLPYHAPFRSLEPYDSVPASLVLLRRFATSPAPGSEESP